MNIGEIINNQRIKLGMTLEDVGKIVGVSKSTVKKWETGYIKNMKRDKIELLANALNLSPLDFLEISEKTRIQQPILTKQEIQLLEAYRNHPEMQTAVNRLLNINEENPTITQHVIENPSQAYKIARTIDGTFKKEIVDKETAEKIRQLDEEPEF